MFPLDERDACVRRGQAKDAELEAVHSREHVESVDLGFQRHPGPEASSFGDIYYSKGTATAARLAAGCTVAVRVNYQTFATRRDVPVGEL